MIEFLKLWIIKWLAGNRTIIINAKISGRLEDNRNGEYLINASVKKDCDNEK